ncbi:MAG: tryptophan 7-halogenase, partial [Saprospiraceae bacterium]|nr:tryptophan 7-halogenase [Saprospiraceae bacterium]
MENNYDVVVIGGGPGGSTASTLLAKKGYKVALLEKEEHPRYTVGESLIPHFWRYTDMLGVSEKILDANFIVKTGGVVSWGDHVRSVRLSDFGFDRPALHVERAEFDDILFKNAQEKGVDTFENTL